MDYSERLKYSMILIINYYYVCSFRIWSIWSEHRVSSGFTKSEVCASVSSLRLFSAHNHKISAIKVTHYLVDCTGRWPTFHLKPPFSPQHDLTFCCTRKRFGAEIPGPPSSPAQRRRFSVQASGVQAFQRRSDWCTSRIGGVAGDAALQSSASRKYEMMHKYGGFTVTYSTAVITLRCIMVMYASNPALLAKVFITLH